MSFYHVWDYRYKPEESLFREICQECISNGYAVQWLERERVRAYYSRNESSASFHFKRLACLIYYVIINDIKTRYDHVLHSNANFEYILNHLDL